ncbi:hypothetical protein TPSD3_04415 [Thioflexithrix psekupsensis]|uniref:GtrA/DPMS transmembrane domain-containing protein n=2 Tax=Thioflexithrix psekupsensis TaxID=1570016 RepID=A0A251XB97_9GAMM|nr:hypothetical protein TPSD3_04415 [Thioflexithrix psekupsensis]
MQFLGFIMVGGTAALLHWLARIILNHWMSFAWAVLLAYGIGMMVAFLLNSIFVFPHAQKPKWQQARDFVGVNLAFLPLVWGAAVFLEYLFQIFGMLFYPQAIAHGIAVAIPMLATFLIYKFFTFKDTEYGR